MQLKQLKCPTCGANLVPKSPQDKIIMCEYCGTVVYIEEETKVVYLKEVTEKERGETELALISLRSGNYEDAKIKFEQGISNNIKNNVAWLGKAAADLHVGNMNESFLAFKKSMELGSPPSMIISWGNYLMSTASYYHYRYFSYASSLDQVYREQKNLYFNYAEAYREYMLEVRKALYEFLISYLQNNSEDTHIMEYALQLAHGMGDYGTMYNLADQLISRESESVIGRYYRGVAALYLGKANEAMDLLYPLLNVMPNNYNIYVYLAYTYAKLGNYEYACETLLSGYARLRNPTIQSTLIKIHGDWLAVDRKAARGWRSSRKKDLKALGLFL